MVTHATLCFVIKDGKVLLLLKAKGRFGEGKWNGLGGKLAEGETPAQCIVREVKEESGLGVMAFKSHGVLRFSFGADPEGDWVVHVFSASQFVGEPRSSPEGELRWFDLKDVPYGSMWEDDRHWLPKVLEGGSVEGRFRFDAEGKRLLGFEMGDSPP